VLWWNDERDDAIEEFSKLAHATPTDSELRLDLAELLETKGDRADALAAADSVTPYDMTTMKRREEIALRLTVAIGAIDRAKSAAERLFGLRLDNAAQLTLAAQMNQLGLGELAESVLARARRRVGNQASALVGLMTQYQNRGQTDTAIQIANQILRSTTAAHQTVAGYYSVDNPDAARQAAINLLSRTDRLKELITRAQEEIKRAPGSIQPHLTLADYYRAAGDKARAAAELNTIATLRPDDPTLQFQVADALMQAGDAQAAIRHYTHIFHVHPESFGRNYWRIQQAFRQAGKIDDYVRLLLNSDFQRIGQSNMILNQIQNLAYDSEAQPHLAALIKKALEAFSNERANVINYLSYTQAFWAVPEIYDYLCAAAIPGKTTCIAGPVGCIDTGCEPHGQGERAYVGLAAAGSCRGPGAAGRIGRASGRRAQGAASVGRGPASADPDRSALRAVRRGQDRGD